MDIVIQLIINSIIAGAIYALIALGFNLVYWVTKFFNIAHGVYAVIAAYTVYYMYTTHGYNMYLSICTGVLLAGIAGVVSDKFIFIKLRKRNASPMTMFVASLGLFTVLQAVVAIMFTNQFRILTESFVSGKSYRFLGGVVTQTHLIIMITVLLMLAILIFMRDRTKFGKAVKAIGDDEEVAKVIGIDTDHIIGHVFFIGSLFAGVGGILIGFDIGIMPTMGMGLLLKAVTASIIGGVGNIYGGLLGAFLIGFAENFGVWQISGEWKDAISFAMLIVFLLFRPRGILGD